MKCLHEIVPGMMMHNIQKEQTILPTNIDEFMDVKSIFVNLPFESDKLLDLSEVILQKATQTWYALLNASRSKLELKQCFSYMLS